jgi:hypothetical protein
MTQETARLCNGRERNRTSQLGHPTAERALNTETSTSHIIAEMTMTEGRMKVTGETTTGTGTTAIIPTEDARVIVTNPEGIGKRKENPIN